MRARLAKARIVLVFCVIVSAVSALATRMNGNWIVVDNQDAADAEGRFGETLSFASIGNTNNYLGAHTYFRKAYAGAPIIYTGTIGGAVPDDAKWLILDSRSTQFAWGRVAQSLGTIAEGVTYNWSIKVGDRTDTLLPEGYTFGLFSLEDGHLQSISALTQAEIAPVSGTLTTNVTWDSSGSGLSGKPLYFVIGLNANSGTTARQLLCDSVSVKTNGVELAVNGGFESGLDSWAVIPPACTWTFKNLPAGDYEVIATWVEFPNRDTAARYSVNGVANVYVNQRNQPGQLLLHDGSGWVRFDSLGTHAADNGILRVTLFADSTTDYVIADAVAVRRISWTDEALASNGSFELPAAPTGSFAPWGTFVPGWMRAGMTSPPLVVSETHSGLPPAAAGSQWGLMDTRSIYNGGGTLLQCLDKVQEGKVYKWSITLGNRTNVDYEKPTEFGLYTVSNGTFVARSVKTAADVTTWVQRSGATQRFSVQWDSFGSGTQGQQLYFMMSYPSLGTTAKQLLIDDLKVRIFPHGTVIVVH